MKMKDIGRILTSLAIFALLVFVSRIGSVLIALFAVGLFLGLIPISVLLVLTAIIASFATKAFHQSKLVLLMFIVLLFSQALILFLWVEGWTAASAFESHPSEPGLPVIDPQLEHTAMVAFWLLAALAVALTIEHLLNAYLKVGPSLNSNHSYKNQMLVLAFEIFLLVALNSSIVNYRRLPREVHVPSSVSPDGTKEIQLVPMNAWIDTNGLVIARKPNSLVWRTVEEIGDSLTEADGGRFVWSDDGSTVYLLLNFYQEKEVPVLGFDFGANKQIDPKSYAARK